MGKLYDLLSSLIEKVNSTVKVSAQTLTDEQKTQARANIGAAADGGGGASVQSNWSQNDETENDFIKNRTHYPEYRVTKLSQKVTLEPDGDNAMCSIDAIGIETGKNYTVICNGIEYSYTAKATEIYGMKFVILGEFDFETFTPGGDVTVMDSTDQNSCSIFFKETLTESITRYVTIIEGENKEEYRKIAIDEGFNAYQNQFVFLNKKTIPYEIMAEGFSSRFSVDGVEYDLEYDSSDTTAPTLRLVENDNVWHLLCRVNAEASSEVLLALGIGTGITFFNDTLSNQTNNPQVDMESLTLKHPVFTPSAPMKKLDEKYLPESVEGVVMRSITDGSTKKFKITVDDSGTITATEVAE